MQITIDTIHDTPEQLRLAAKFIGELRLAAKSLGELAGPAADTVGVNAHPTVKAAASVEELPPAHEPIDAAQCEWVETEAASDPEPSEELDADGRPWSGELHSAGKTKTADGKWRKRKGVNAVFKPDDPSTVTADEIRESNTEENLAAIAANCTPPPPPPASLFDAQAPVPNGGVVTFPELVQLVLKHGCAPADVLAACQAEGVAAMPMLAAQPDKVGAVAARLGVL